jgi:hypothetical protein
MMMHQVTPNVRLANGNTCHALITYVPLYPVDTGKDQLGIDFGFHWGDNESLRVCAVHNDRTDQWSPYSILIKRHFDEPQGYLVGATYDHGFIEVRDATHVIMHVSQDKHAMYISYGECEAYDIVPNMINFAFENCDGGPEGFIPIFDEHNVGERDQPAFNFFFEAPGTLMADYYPRDAAWFDIPFCGASPNPLDDHRKDGACAGSNGAKLWPPVNYDPDHPSYWVPDPAEVAQQIYRLTYGY